MFAFIDNIKICSTSKKNREKNMSAFLSCAAKYGLTLNNSKKSIVPVTNLKGLLYEVQNRQTIPNPDRLQALRNLQIPSEAELHWRAVVLF